MSLLLSEGWWCESFLSDHTIRDWTEFSFQISRKVLAKAISQLCQMRAMCISPKNLKGARTAHPELGAQTRPI